MEIALEGPEFRLVRKIGWIFFIVIFIGLWITRREEIAGKWEWVYPATAAVAVVMLFIDGTIQGYLSRFKIEKARAWSKGDQAITLKRKLTELDKDYAEGTIDDGEYMKRTKKINKRLKKLQNSKY